jgi:hypothetical protein
MGTFGRMPGKYELILNSISIFVLKQQNTKEVESGAYKKQKEDTQKFSIIF